MSSTMVTQHDAEPNPVNRVFAKIVFLPIKVLSTVFVNDATNLLRH